MARITRFIMRVFSCMARLVGMCSRYGHNLHRNPVLSLKLINLVHTNFTPIPIYQSMFRCCDSRCGGDSEEMDAVARPTRRLRAEHKASQEGLEGGSAGDGPRR